MSYSPWLLALDVDGTIVDYDNVLTDRVRTSITEVIAAGHHVVFATGRGVYGLAEIAQRFDLTSGWGVACNGSVLVNLVVPEVGGLRLHRVSTFDPQPALKLIRDQLPTSVLYVEADDPWKQVGTAPPPPDITFGPVQVVPEADLSAWSSACRIAVSTTSADLQSLSDAVAVLGLRLVEYGCLDSVWFDVAPAGVSKSAGLEQIRRELQIPHERTLAIGDGGNDVAMFAWAQHSVAMGQAPPAVQVAADVVTASVGDDGAAIILERLLQHSP